MAQMLNNSKPTTRDAVADDARNESMREYLRKAAEIGRSLEWRKLTDSTILVAEDRPGRRFN
jgi:hypothetical protein